MATGCFGNRVDRDGGEHRVILVLITETVSSPLADVGQAAVGAERQRTG